MKRHIGTILAACSLLLCVTATAAWVRSLMGDTILVGSIPGAFAVGGWNASREFLQHFYGPTTSDSRALRGLSRSGDVEHRALGFAYVSGNRNGADYWIIAIPYWLIVPLTAILPIRWWALRRRRRDRVVTGRCPGCGYDLRATPGRCPECGASNAAHSMPTAEPAIP